MIGDKLSEGKGKRIGRRVLSVDPPTAEVSFEDAGTFLGVSATGMGTYTSTIQPDGSLFADGQGLIMTQEGDTVTWEGTGFGKFGAAGSVSYRGMVFYRTTSQKLARANNCCGAFEFEADAAGNTTGRVWEWK
jgi:hypothetical protein